MTDTNYATIKLMPARSPWRHDWIFLWPHMYLLYITWYYKGKLDNDMYVKGLDIFTLQLIELTCYVSCIKWNLKLTPFSGCATHYMGWTQVVKLLPLVDFTSGSAHLSSGVPRNKPGITSPPGYILLYYCRLFHMIIRIDSLLIWFQV